MTDPQRDLEVNVTGTRRMLEAARAIGKPRFVFVSSGGAVYGETRGAATERTAPRPASYYGMHKLLAEHYVRNAGLPWAIARPANVFGPRQLSGSDGAVVPSFIRSARAGQPLTIHGDGSQVRDLVFVSDAVDALFHRIARLGWHPGTSLVDGVRATVADALKRADT